jgi:hypothetical protein
VKGGVAQSAKNIVTNSAKTRGRQRRGVRTPISATSRTTATSPTPATTITTTIAQSVEPVRA